MTADLEDAPMYTWTERWLMTQSTAHAKRQQEALLARVSRAEEALGGLRVKKDERAPDLPGGRQASRLGRNRSSRGER